MLWFRSATELACFDGIVGQTKRALSNADSGRKDSASLDTFRAKGFPGTSYAAEIASRAPAVESSDAVPCPADSANRFKRSSNRRLFYIYTEWSWYVK